MTTSPWPLTATDSGGVLSIGGMPVTELAEEFGTPLWVLDEADLRDRCRAYREAFPGVDVGYASKAWCAVGILRIVAEEGLSVDVASAGELHTAHVAGVPMERVIFHGNNKSVAEIEMAAELGVGRVVADSMAELDRLEAFPLLEWQGIEQAVEALEPHGVVVEQVEEDRVPQHADDLRRRRVAAANRVLGGLALASRIPRGDREDASGSEM